MWKVFIPAGRWMAGANSFSTKKRAMEFMDRWNTVEVNSGHFSICWMRDDKSFKPVI
jgi:hypothetical protein